MSSPKTCPAEFSPLTRGFNASIRSGMTQAARDKVSRARTSDERVVVAPFRYYIGIFSEYERDDAYAGV